MENLVWTEHVRGHWETDHRGMCLHVFKSLNGSCWSVYDGDIEIDGRGAMVSFEEAKARAVAAVERWNGKHDLADVADAPSTGPLSAYKEVEKNWVECNKAWQERDRYLEAVRNTFRVLDERGQAPDDNAPLEVTARRVLDFLDRVTAERDALAAQLAALKKRVADAQKARAFVRQDSGLQVFPPPWKSRSTGKHVRVALLRLENGE